VYDSTDLAFGETPAVYSFNRLSAFFIGPKGPYTGEHRVILIQPEAQGTDAPGHPIPTTTGIDTFKDTVIHENYHAITQSVDYTNTAFALGITGASPVADSHWSFNINIPAAIPVPPLPAGRVYNHYRDHNGDGDFADAGEDLDIDGDDVINSSEPAIQGNRDLENPAYGSEPNIEHGLARRDWGNPGKNHRTLNNYND
jgi:hypothetical protein